MMKTEAASETKAASGAEMSGEGNKYLAFARYMLVATLVVAGVALLLLFVWYAADLLLLVFAGVLVSILLRGISRFVREKTGIGHGFSIALVAVALLAVVAVSAWLVTGRLGSQVTDLQQKIPQAVEDLNRYIGQYEWAREAMASLPSVSEWFTNRSATIISRVTGLASTTLSAVLNTVVVLIIGLYLAFQPELYSGGIKHLLPFRFRNRAGEIFGTIDEALSRWLIGRLILMTINGVLTGIGLWFLGVPLALTLGLLCGMLNFIPNFGPWIAAVPALLIAFLQSPQQALYVAVLYVVLQSLDGYVFTPLVDRKSVELPPVVTITAQVLLGVAFGFIGILLASPLTATLMILVKMLYVEDVLDDPIMEESKIGEQGSGNNGNAKNDKSDEKRSGDADDA